MVHWDKRSLDVFRLSDPLAIDVIDLVGMGRATLHEILEWHQADCDTEGCLKLENPACATPRLALSHIRIPCISLMDELEADGWHPVLRKVVHSIEGEKARSA